MPNPGDIVAYCGLAALQGALVVLPRPVGPGAWSRLRSPGWAMVLPAALIVGTFGVLEVPHGATGLAVLAAIATPVLAWLAVMGVVRGPRWAWLAALPVLGVAVTLHSWPAPLAASALTALGCLTLGAALVRLTPLRWLAAGVAVMCIVDVALLAAGVGQPAATQLETALSHSSFPEFHRAQFGSMNRDYPDLVLSAALGTVLAGHARQLTAAVLVTVLSSANGLFFLIADILPATVPLSVAAGVVVVLEWRGARTRLPSHKTRRPALNLSPRQPGAVQPMEA